jgi:hypothetical protein
MSLRSNIKLLYMNDEGVVIECKFVPSSGKNELAVAAQVEAKICSKCGYMNDANLKAKEMLVKSQGKKDFKIMCLNPNSPYLVPIKEELKRTGKLKFN